MSKKTAIWNTRNSKFSYRNVELFTHKFYRFIHIINTQVFSYQTKKMFGAPGDNNFIFFNVYKLDGVANEIAPGAGIGAYENRIIFIFLHLMYHKGFRIFNHISFAVEIFIIKWNKLKKNIIINSKLHSFGILPVLIAKKTFTCKIGFYKC